MRKKHTGKTVVIGLTGGIASGTSSVAAEFKKQGAYIIDADVIARNVVKPGSTVWKSIVRYFGRDILLPGRKLNRKKLAGVVFSSPSRRRKLEELTHPLIIREIKKNILSYRKRGKGPVVVNAPLLFETGLEKVVDMIVVVRVPVRIQLIRLMKRDSLNRKAALQRIHAQVPLRRKAARADHIIDNSGAPGQIGRQVKQLWKLIILIDKQEVNSYNVPD